MVNHRSQNMDSFVDHTYTLTIQVEGEGITLPGVGTYIVKKNSVVEIEALPRDGWEFKEWIGDVSAQKNRRATVLLNSHKTIKTVFREQEDLGADPRIDKAIAWALALKGAKTFPDGTTVKGFCLRFVQDAYEKGAATSIIRYVGARIAAERTGAIENIDKKIPRGAFVYFDWLGDVKGKYKNWGHVGLYLGDSQLIHAFHHVRIDTIQSMRLVDEFLYKGWSWPSLRPSMGSGSDSLWMP